MSASSQGEDMKPTKTMPAPSDSSNALANRVANELGAYEDIVAAVI